MTSAAGPEQNGRNTRGTDLVENDGLQEQMKLRKKLWIAGVRAEIRTRCLQNTNEKCYYRPLGRLRSIWKNINKTDEVQRRVFANLAVNP
jgi:hypothetical protein